ncbi:MAG: zinc ABC transporter substrate-binding protein [Candidatus Aminicenantes bacterium]|nr:zinc ABC transporter substrate-binding protein [Candidatus Aminicenantes bacterium]
MNRLRFSSFLLIVSFSFFPVNASASSPSPTRAAGDKIKVVATVFPLAEFAREIIGDRGEIVLLLPPGIDVHTWQPRISDIRKLEAADLLVSIGLGLEPWLDSLIKGMAVKKTSRLEAALGLDLIATNGDEHTSAAGRSHGHEGFDPHVWLDFGQDEAIVDALACALSRIAPDGAGLFSRNADVLKERLRALDASFRADLEKFRGKEFFVAGHAAFAYLARRYGIKQVAVYGLSPDAAPTPREMVEIISRAKASGVKTVFYEPAAGDKMARLIAAEIGADVRILFPGHNLNPEQTARGVTFFRLMEENLENLKHGFAGN